MAKNKTLLQTLGFTYGESEITFAFLNRVLEKVG